MDLKTLQDHLRKLAALEESHAPVISCYANLGAGKDHFQEPLEQRIALLRRRLAGKHRQTFEEALAQIQDYLESAQASRFRGAAVFARGGEQPLFLPFRFHVPLPNALSAGPAPELYHLVELQDTYACYVVLLAAESWARILEVNLGALTREIQAQRPDLRRRVGREWTQEHYRSQLRDRKERFLKDVVGTLERLIAHRGHHHLILAGEPRATARLRNLLPTHLTRKVVATVSAANGKGTNEVLSATLASFLEQEERESRAMAERVCREALGNGFAVAGARACLGALRAGQAEALVMAKGYDPGYGWACVRCPAVDATKPPGGCPCCGRWRLRTFLVREEMVRLAARARATIEIVRRSDSLMRMGGVGCLLRYLTSEKRLRAS